MLFGPEFYFWKMQTKIQNGYREQTYGYQSGGVGR